MIKKIILLVVGVLFVFSASQVLAVENNNSNLSLSSLQEMVQKLTQQVNELLVKINEMRSPITNNQNGNVSSKSDENDNEDIVLDEVENHPRVSCKLPEMEQGHSSESVYLLQSVLKSEGSYPEGLVTGYFGRLTQKAILTFQKENNIETDSGIVDKQTAEALNKLVYKYYPSECGGNVFPPIIGGIKVYSPSLGEEWYIGNTYKIKWTSGISPDTKVKITVAPPRLACLDANPPCMTVSPLVAEPKPYIISETTENNGVFEWKVPELPSQYVGSQQITIQAINGSTVGRSEMFSIKKQDVSDNKSPVISGITGPTSLKINETGTWTIKAYDPENKSLSYSILWGDETVAVSAQNKNIVPFPFQQQGTFTHIYNVAGIYNPTFTIVDDKGQTVQTSLSVNVGENINILSTLVKVTSPESGAQWKVGETYTIKWSGGGYAGEKFIGISPNVTITVAPPRPACLDSIPACKVAEFAPYIIVKDVSNYGSYSWTIPKELPTVYRGVQQISVTVGSQIGRSSAFSIVSLDSKTTSMTNSQMADILNAASEQLMKMFKSLR